jgi:hypothetical protein
MGEAEVPSCIRNKEQQVYSTLIEFTTPGGRHEQLAADLFKREDLSPTIQRQGIANQVGKERTRFNIDRVQWRGVSSESHGFPQMHSI